MAGEQEFEQGQRPGVSPAGAVRLAAQHGDGLLVVLAMAAQRRFDQGSDFVHASYMGQQLPADLGLAVMRTLAERGVARPIYQGEVEFVRHCLPRVQPGVVRGVERAAERIFVPRIQPGLRLAPDAMDPKRDLLARDGAPQAVELFMALRNQLWLGAFEGDPLYAPGADQVRAMGDQRRVRQVAAVGDERSDGALVARNGRKCGLAAAPVHGLRRRRRRSA